MSGLRRAILRIPVLAVIASLAACGDGDDPTTPAATAPPEPRLLSIRPAEAFQGETSFSLFLDGEDFVNPSEEPVVLWNGWPRPTLRIDASGLRAEIPTSDLASAGEVAVRALIFDEEGDTLPTNTVNFTVRPAPTSVEITPTTAATDVGSALQFTATAELADGSRVNVTERAVWGVDELAVARVSNVAGSKGRATGASAGATRVSVNFLSRTAAASLVVEGLDAIEIAPADFTLSVGETRRLMATGRFPDGSVRNITHVVEWRSSDPAIAGFVEAEGPGVLEARASGMATVSASLAGVSVSTRVAVVP